MVACCFKKMINKTIRLVVTFIKFEVSEEKE